MAVTGQWREERTEGASNPYALCTGGDGSVARLTILPSIIIWLILTGHAHGRAVIGNPKREPADIAPPTKQGPHAGHIWTPLYVKQGQNDQ